MPDLGFVSDPTDPGNFQGPEPHVMVLPRFWPGKVDSSFNEIGMQRIIEEFISGWQKETSEDPTLFISLHEQDFTKDFVDWINSHVGKGNIKLKTIADAFKNDISWNIPGDFPNSKNYSNFHINQFSTGNWSCENCDVSVSLIPMIGSQTGPYQTSAATCNVPTGLYPNNTPHNTTENKETCEAAGCSWSKEYPWGWGCRGAPDISSIPIDLACKSGIITGNLTDICNNCYINTPDTVNKIPILEYENSLEFITNSILSDKSIVKYIPPSEDTSGTFWFGNPLGNNAKPQGANTNLICQNYTYCPTPKLTDTSGCDVSGTIFCNYNYYSIARPIKTN